MVNDFPVSELAPTPDQPEGSELAPLFPPGESRVREYLSNERTYLSWMRSAISMMGLGVIIARLPTLQPLPASGVNPSWQLGLVFSLVGLLIVFFSTQHYLVVRHDITDDTYQPTGRWIALLSLIVLLLGTGIIYYVFTYTLLPKGGAA